MPAQRGRAVFFLTWALPRAPSRPSAPPRARAPAAALVLYVGYGPGHSSAVLDAAAARPG
jgi:hypothetical protein